MAKGVSGVTLGQRTESTALEEEHADNPRQLEDLRAGPGTRHSQGSARRPMQLEQT